MRHHHDIGEAALGSNAERATRRTQVFVAPQTCRAFAASDPGLNNAAIADSGAGNIRPNSDDFAENFVA